MFGAPFHVSFQAIADVLELDRKRRDDALMADLQSTIDRWFGVLSDNARPAYIRVSVLKKALTNQKVLDALLDRLEVPGKPQQLRRLPDDEKAIAIFDHVGHLTKSKTSPFYGQSGAEVVAAGIWLSDLSNKLVSTELYRSVRKEAHLLEPAVAWLKAQGFETYAEIYMGLKRADVVGHRPPQWGGLRGRVVVAIELKNNRKEFERAIDQMTTYRDYAHQVWLACTPAMAAEYLEAHYNVPAVKRWDDTVFDRKLRALGFGLLLIEGNEVFDFMPPQGTSPAAAKLEEVVRQFNERTRR